VSVTVGLSRPNGNGGLTQVASVTTSANASGAWGPVALSPTTDAYGAPEDVLTTTYALGTAPGGTPLPLNGAYSESASSSQTQIEFQGGNSSIEWRRRDDHGAGAVAMRSAVIPRRRRKPTTAVNGHRFLPKYGHRFCRVAGGSLTRRPPQIRT
jgi:hypothetical protein